MEGHPAFPDFENVEWMGEIISRIVDEHIAQPPAYDDAESTIDQKVVDALGAGPFRPSPVAIARDDAADEEPAKDEPSDIGERISSDGQRPPLHENGIDRRKGQNKSRHRRDRDAPGPARRQDSAAESPQLTRVTEFAALRLSACAPRGGRKSDGPLPRSA